MAHRVNVIQVIDSVKRMERDEFVTDPVCQIKLSPIQAKHMLFRREHSYYFCSKNCELKFSSPEFHLKKIS